MVWRAASHCKKLTFVELAFFARLTFKLAILLTGKALFFKTFCDGHVLSVFSASIKMFKIFCAAMEMTVPGPKMAATPLL